MARNDPILGWPKETKPRSIGLLDFDFGSSKEPKPPHRRQLMARIAMAFGLFWAVFVGGIVFYYLVSEFPEANDLLVYDPGKDVTLIDVEGRTIARRGHNQGEIVALDTLPSYVGNAFVAIEDRRFRHHFGIDPWGLGRATVVNVSAGSFVQGGSTPTQQLAKNLFLKPERTIKRKLDEALLAIYLESRYTKD